MQTETKAIDKVKIPEDIARILLRKTNARTKKRTKQWKEYVNETVDLFEKHKMDELHTVISIKKLCYFMEVFGNNKKLFNWFKKLSPEESQRVAHSFVPPYLNRDEIWPNVTKFGDVLIRP
jgi:CHAD domain-containing protein